MEGLKDKLLNRGASLVGFARIKGLYKEYELSSSLIGDSERDYFNMPQYPFGISIAIKVPIEVIKGISEGPTIDYFNTYLKLNDSLDELGLYCEEYLISKGYDAYAQTVDRTKEYGVLKTIMPHKTVATCAGIGWIGKSTLLVTPEFGSAVRLTSVLTNAPLRVPELALDSPCKGCNICKEACPAGAIVGNVWNKGSEREYIFDALMCRKTARRIAQQAIKKEITLCGKCIEVCPFTKRYLESEC